MEIGMTVVVPAAVLPLAYADTRTQEHDVLAELIELPVTVFDPLSAVEAPELGRVLAAAGDPVALTRDALALAHVVHSAHRRGWPVLTGNPTGLRALDVHLDLDELP
jgi:hypothetical protein